mgnify:CR=1 FL=1
MVQWTKEQQLAIDESGQNILVSAAAGSGKTAVLVERIIQKLVDKDSPINIDEILVSTFTNAAAEEMRNRIGAALEKAIAKDPTSYHLKKQLSLLQRASISTLHSFCTTVVRQYAYMLDLDPAFRIADEMEIELIKQEVIDEMFEDFYGEEGETLENFFTVVDMFSSDRSDVEVEKLILKLYTFAMQNPQPEKWLRSVAETYDIPEDCDEAEIEWLTYLKEEVKDKLTSFRHDIQRALEIANESDGPYHYVDALQADIQQIDEALNRVDEWDRLQQFMNEAKLKSLSSKRVECNEDKKESIKQIRNSFREAWNKMKKEWFSRKLSAHLEDMRKLKPAITHLTELVIEFKNRFNNVKREKALVDFSDLEHFCLAILTEKNDEDKLVPSEVARYYQQQFKEILVDEYQDINNVQETILTVVSDMDGPGNMFMVGDVKQSIYRFRHAEPELFIEKYKKYERDTSAGLRIDLAKNFRSRKDVLDSANYIFRQIFDEALGDIDYDEKAELVYGNLSYDDFPVDDVETELIIIDRDHEEEQTRNDGEESVEDVAAAQFEARLYAEKINEWIGKKGKAPVQVLDKETNTLRDVQFRDIVILQRSLTGVATIVDELKKQGIPVHAELRTGYFVAIEIQVMINMLKVIDNPYQDIPLVSVLRSPIVGLNEEQLAQIRVMQKYEPFYEAVKKYATANEEASHVVKEFLEQLAQFRILAKNGSLSELIWQIFQETGYYDFVGGIPGGRQRQANLRALYDRARGYESTSFRGLFRFLRFIEWMQEEKKDLGEARALSEQEDVVRIMTIHKSKGLEFPIVIIGGMHKEFNFRDIHSKYILDKDLYFATKFIDPEKRITYPTLYYLALKEESLRKMLAEEMRVLYVAMTRAKEKLVMIGSVPSAEKKLTNWQPLAEYPEWVLPMQLRKSAKTYLDWVGPALMRHKQTDILRKDGVVVKNVPAEIEQDVARFKVAIIPASQLINLDREERLTNETLKKSITEWEKVPGSNEANRAFVTDRMTYQYEYEEAANTRAKQSVTEIKRRFELMDEYSDDRIVAAFRPPIIKRPNFLQKEKKLTAAEVGTAMHTVMQHLPLTKQYHTEELTEKVAQFVNEEKLTDAEAEVIDLHAIERFFQSDIAKLMIESEKVEREIPFTYTLPTKDVYHHWKSNTEEAVLIQGVVDCLIYTDDGVIILDYKTDAIYEDVVTEQVMQMLKERYEVQIELYKRALEDILKQPVKEAYLYFFAKDLLIQM